MNTLYINIFDLFRVKYQLFCGPGGQLWSRDVLNPDLAATCRYATAHTGTIGFNKCSDRSLKV